MATAAGRFMSFRVWNRYIREWGRWGHPFPTTMPTSVIVAYKKVLEIALEEGLDNRAERHRRVSAEMRQRLRRTGFEMLAHLKIAFLALCLLLKCHPRDRIKLGSEWKRNLELLFLED